MIDNRQQQTITYQLRHYLMFNVTDLLSDTARGNAEYTQYFSGTGAAGQVNYLERKLLTSGRFLVYVYVGGAWVLKTATTHYTHSNTTGMVTWGGYMPPSGTDNIKVVYQSVKSWIFDDHPALSTGYFPRITVDYVRSEHITPCLGVYKNYTGEPGDWIKSTYKIIVRDRPSERDDLTYGNTHLKNFDLVSAINANIIRYLNSNKFPCPWNFYDWKILDNQRIRTEEMDKIMRMDMTVEIMHFDIG